MRILMLNKFLYPRGGAETQMLELGAALKREGHEVAYFGTYDRRNCAPPEASFTFYCTEPGSANLRDAIGFVWNIFTGRSGRRMLAQAIRMFEPDVIHAHNVYHQIGCALLPQAKETGRPLLMTLHDYKLVCPTYNMFDGSTFCFACRHRRYWNALFRSCHRFGRTASTLLAAESFWADLNRFYHRGIDRFIVPSRYLQRLITDSGIPRRRTFLLPNAIDLRKWQYDPTPGTHFLYVGRLSREKGVGMLLDILADLPEIRLRIVGRGPLEKEVRAASEELDNVEYVGALPPDGVAQELRACRALVVPTTCPENCPMVILEAFATGRPVIATEVGGVPELFEHTDLSPGLTVPPGDTDSLRDALILLSHEDGLVRRMGQVAREIVEARHDLDAYVETICQLYRNPALDTVAVRERHESVRRQTSSTRPTGAPLA